MSASGNSVNYGLRTAKSVERKMLSASVKELLEGVNYKKRRYIGMGSNYFIDFKLFHKDLHIDSMISFESEEGLKKRVEFNKPFKCIDIMIGSSTSLLPTIKWDKFVDFIWMDYDVKLQYEYFADIEIIFSNISKGSIYLMSCNKQLYNYKTVEEFTEIFGNLVPIDTHINDFNGENDFALIRRMLLNKINDVLRNRNYGLPERERLVFRQLFFFTYRDGAPMISYGGYIDYAMNDFNLKDYNFNGFNFIRTGDERFVIDTPLITHKEINLLNSCLPNTEKSFNNLSKISFIPENDRNNFKKLYKFLPTYMDVVY